MVRIAERGGEREGNLLRWSVTVELVNDREWAGILLNLVQKNRIYRGGIIGRDRIAEVVNVPRPVFTKIARRPPEPLMELRKIQAIRLDRMAERIVDGEIGRHKCGA